jgi:hypothetical protein
MAWLSAYLPVDQAAGIWNRATTAARAMQGPAETRTLSQLRVDAAAAWLLGPAPGVGSPTDDPAAGALSTAVLSADSAPAGGVPSPKAQVLVTVPVFSLLGLSGEPATLDGYGPIPPSMARRLVADGATSFLRVLTDPRDGAPLEIGRTSYRLTKPMRQWLRLRDAKCTFPNCNNHSLDNDADHILAWADGGGTGVTNLGQPCPKHHRLKHSTAWQPVGATRDAPPGWTSPSGRSYPAEHQDWEPPTWPEPPPGPDWRGIHDWRELPRGQDWPEPPISEELPMPPNWTDASEPPDDLDDVEHPMDIDGVDPPLPADPWPYWSSTAA